MCVVIMTHTSQISVQTHTRTHTRTHTHLSIQKGLRLHTLHGTNLRLHTGTHIMLKLQLGTVLRWCASIDPPSKVHFVSLFLKNADVHDADGNGDCCHVRLHHITSKRYVEIQSGQHIDWPMWPGAISGPMLTTRGGGNLV